MSQIEDIQPEDIIVDLSDHVFLSQRNYAILSTAAIIGAGVIGYVGTGKVIEIIGKTKDYVQARKLARRKTEEPQ